MSMREDFTPSQPPVPFPARKATTTKYFNGNPRNPFSRWISLEKAANYFLILYAVFMVILIIFWTLLIGLYSHMYSKHGISSGHLRGISGIPGLIDKLGNYKDRFSTAESIIMLVISILYAIPTIYSALCCKRHLNQGCIEGAKLHYVILLVLVALDLLGSLIADWDSMLFISVYVIPYSVISVLGMYMTYNYILERIQLVTNVSSSAVGPAANSNTANSGQCETV